MKSSTSERFRKMLRALPYDVRQQAREAYRYFQADPHHPGLQFKKVHTVRLIYSARVNLDYRAVGILDDDEITWFWIGPHNEYEKLLRRL